MKSLKLLFTFLLCLLFSFSYAQKKPIKKTIKPKQTATKKQVVTAKKPTIRNDIEGIKKLLDNGEITLYEAYESQIKRINEVQQNVKDKKFRVNENVEGILLPDENAIIFNFHNRSLSIITNSSVNREVYPEIQLSSILALAVQKNANWGEVDLFLLGLDPPSEYVSVKNNGSSKNEIAMLFYPKGDKQAYEKLRDAFINIVLLYKMETPRDKTYISKTQETEDLTRIIFE